MRGILVDAQRFRQIRRARGLGQAELASIAGVSERTVRNAEVGKPVRMDFLRFLATALGVDLAAIVQDVAELRVAARDDNQTEHVVRALKAFAEERDLSEFRNLVAPDVRIRVRLPAEIPLGGEYSGFDGFQKLLDINQVWLETEQPIEVTDIYGTGELVVISGTEWFRALPTGKRYHTWWQHIYQYEKGRVIRIDTLAVDHALFGDRP